MGVEDCLSEGTLDRLDALLEVQFKIYTSENTTLNQGYKAS